MSSLIRCNSIAESTKLDVCKSFMWFLISCLLTMLLSISLVAQEPAGEPKPPADAEPLETLKFDPAYDMTKPELQLDGSESRTESRAIRANIKVVRDQIRDAEKRIKLALEGNSGISSVGGVFDSFMSGYVFAKMTQTDDQTLATLGEIREDFVDDYLSEKVKGGSRQRVIQVTIPTMQKIIDGNFHPAVKLNAMITLGLIDEKPASRKSVTLPSPSADAMRYLTQVFTSDYPAYLKIGALAGILRNVEIDHLRNTPQMPGTDAISREALAIIQGGGVGSANWSPEAKYWLKRRATQVLGFLGQPGVNGIVVDEFIKIAQDPQASKWLRLDAIAGLGRLNYAGVDGQKAVKIPPIVANYVAESLEFESVDLMNKLDELIAINILYEDIDLEKEGNSNSRKKGGDRSGGIGAGGGAGLEGGEGGFGSSQQTTEEIDLGPQVEIATYHLNSARRVVKVIAFTARETLGSKSLSSLVDKALVASLTSELDSFIANSDIGITNLEEDDESELDRSDPNFEAKFREAKKTNTIKMSDLFAATAKDIRRLVPSADAEGDGDPLGGN